MSFCSQPPTPAASLWDPILSSCLRKLFSPSPLICSTARIHWPFSFPVTISCKFQLSSENKLKQNHFPLQPVPCVSPALLSEQTEPVSAVNFVRVLSPIYSLQPAPWQLLSTPRLSARTKGKLCICHWGPLPLSNGPGCSNTPSWNSSFLSGSSPSGQLMSPALSLPRSEFPVGNIATPGRWGSLRFWALNKLVSLRMEHLNFPLLPPGDCKLLQNGTLPQLPSSPPNHSIHRIPRKPDLWAADENLADILASQRKVLHGCCALVCLVLRTSILH